MAISASLKSSMKRSVKRPSSKSISRVPRCQARNTIRRLRISASSCCGSVIDIPNAKSPDSPGGLYIAMQSSFVRGAVACATRFRQFAPMRPAILNPLFASLKTLKGVGDKIAKPFGRLLDREEPRIVDLLFHLPYSAIDRRSMPKLADVQPDSIVTLEITVDKHIPGRGRAPYKIRTHQGMQTLDIVYFHMSPDRAEKMFPVDATRYVSGLVTTYDGQFQMTHPDRVGDEKDLPQMLVVEPVYPLTEGLAAGTMRRTAAGALTRITDLPEWCDPAFLAQKKFAPFSAALRRMHAPEETADVLPESPFRARLAYDELLSHQLALALLRTRIRREKGRKSVGDGRLRAKIEAALPFSLTDTQQAAIQEI